MNRRVRSYTKGKVKEDERLLLDRVGVKKWRVVESESFGWGEDVVWSGEVIGVEPGIGGEKAEVGVRWGRGLKVGKVEVVEWWRVGRVELVIGWGDWRVYLKEGVQRVNYSRPDGAMWEGHRSWMEGLKGRDALVSSRDVKRVMEEWLWADGEGLLWLDGDEWWKFGRELLMGEVRCEGKELVEVVREIGRKVKRVGLGRLRETVIRRELSRRVCRLDWAKWYW